MKALVIIPTYNERMNIRTIVKRVLAEHVAADLSVLVVDDRSPDETAIEVKELQRDPAVAARLFLLERDAKNGLGGAYIAGFRWALERDYDVIVEMDADMSHDPSYLPAMLDALDSVDFVIGSRYVHGGGVEGWGLPRKFVSRGGSLFSRAVLGMKLHDLTGGFNAWNRRVLEKIGLDQIISTGYCFQIELKYRAALLGFTTCELPIIFVDRKYGESKMSGAIFWEAVKNVIILRRKVKRG